MIRYDTEALEARKEMMRTAQAMLSGALPFIEGAIRIDALRIGLSDQDPLLRPFVLIASETDALPLGKVRDLWAPQALAELQPSLDDAEAWAEEVGRPACEGLISRLTELL
jgi:hypothetical protein